MGKCVSVLRQHVVLGMRCFGVRFTLWGEMGAKIKPGIEIKSSVMQCAKAGRGMGRYLFLNENLLQTDNRSHRKEEIIIVPRLCTVELLHYYVPDTDVFFLP